MVLELTSVAYEPRVRGLCAKPYPLHPKGCPNFGKKPGCPPEVPLLPDVFDLSAPCFLIVNTFDFAAHVARMRVAHPDWSERQLTCCLYWQGTARKDLERRIVEFKRHNPGHLVTRCPEAMGLNVTETLHRAGQQIEWPPLQTALQVAFAGLPRTDGLRDKREF